MEKHSIRGLLFGEGRNMLKTARILLIISKNRYNPKLIKRDISIGYVSLMKILYRLKEKDLIIIEKDNHRYIKVYLTSKGKEVVIKLSKIIK